MATHGQPAVGIDLGTSNSCVAMVQDGEPRVLVDDDGHSIHSSVVSFRPDGRVVVGQSARKYVLADPARTVYSAKRLMGRFYFSDEVKKAQLRYGYEIVEGENNSVLIDVSGRKLTPQEVGAFVLRKMKAIAEKHAQRPVEGAVITVPAYFNDNQRQATRDAGRIAGLEVLRIINEPTAAALAYGFGKDLTQRVAVYDLGGGTFDVSILEIGRDIYEVLSTAGDTYLGGDDIDDRIVTFLCNVFHQQTGVDLRSNRTVFPRLLDAAERGKRELATQTETRFELPAISADQTGRPRDLTATLTQDELGRMTMDLLQRTFKVCDEALQRAHMVATDLDGVVLVGGPTRLPFIRSAVAHYFQSDPKVGVDPHEVVALGAALQAHTLLYSTAPTTLLDVTPLTLRIGTVAGYSEPIIEKNTPIPIESSRIFTTVKDNQERVQVMVLQGESRRQEECERLGQFEFSGLRRAPRGDVKIEVAFEIDANGIVNVSAKDTETGRKASTTIRLSGGLSDETIETRRVETERSSLLDAETAIVPLETLEALRRGDPAPGN